MASGEKQDFYENYNKFKYIVNIKAVIKGRHNSTEKDTFDLLEVTGESENKWDKKAFRINPIIPVSATYGHVPCPLNVVFYQMCQLSDEIGTAYEIWCKPTENSRENKPCRWKIGGGIDQDCVYSIYCGSLLFEKLMDELEIIQADNCEVELLSDI